MNASKIQQRNGVPCEAVNELPEAKEWPALGNFVKAINRLEQFRTCGCTASGRTEGGYEAPFVDIAFDDQRLWNSSAAYDHLSAHFVNLHETDTAGQFVLELCGCGATLPDGKDILSLRLWLLGNRDDAPAVFEAVLSLLARQDIGEYLAIGANENGRGGCGG